MAKRTLIAGIGNIFLGDDGFGSELAREMQQHSWPMDVDIVDFGIRSLDLTYRLMDGQELVIMLDTIHQNGPPGTLYLFEPDISNLDGAIQNTAVDAHNLDPFQVLQAVRASGAPLGRVLIIGCEPADFGDELQGRMGLSPAVAGAVPRAIDMVRNILTQHHRPPLAIPTDLQPTQSPPPQSF